MKSMKGLSMNRMIGTIKRRTGTGLGGGVEDAPDPQGESPEATAARALKQFCEAGGPNNQGDEVLFLPTIVEAAESSPAAASECARLIRKYLSKEYMAKASWQYNAIMLVRILTDNPGHTFTRNMDKKFVDTVKDLLRNCRDPSVRQMLMETLDTFENTKFDDDGLAMMIEMWKREKERAYKTYGHRMPPAQPTPRTMNAPPFDAHSQNYFARSHSNRALPSPVELAGRLEEARTSAKLLSQVVVNTPPQEVLNNDLIKEFADRCQSASRSIQLYMVADNPSPDNETMESLIDTNEQLQSALNQHQRAVLGARKQMGIGARVEDRSPDPAVPPEPMTSRPQQWQQPSRGSSSNSTPTPPLPARPGASNGKGKATENFEAPPGPPPKTLPDEPIEDPFKDPLPEPSSSKAGGSSNFVAELPSDEPRLAFEPYHPGFNTTPSYLGRQESAVGKLTMSGAGSGSGAGADSASAMPNPLSANPVQPHDLRERRQSGDDSDDIYASTPQRKEPMYRY